MAARARRINPRADYWPAFVDVLTNLLLVFIFLLSIFALVQFLLSREITGQDTVLQRLNAQIAELTEMLALEKAGSSELSRQPRQRCSASLAAAESERNRLQGLLDEQSSASASAGGQVAALDRRTRRREAGEPAGAVPGRAAQPADRGAPPPDRGDRRRARRLGGEGPAKARRRSPTSAGG